MSWNGVLVGAQVEAVTFGCAHFQLRLLGDNGSFLVSSNADISFDPSGADAVDFREAKVARGLVDLVGAEWAEVKVADDESSATIHFKQGQAVRAWWPETGFDNLFIVQRDGADEWGTIG